MKTEKLTKAICVWLDTTSEPDAPAWIVSRDEIDESGRAVTTDTLTAFHENDEDAAWSEALEQADNHGLPIYENSEQGPAKLAHSALAVAMAAHLKARGDQYAGSNPWDMAEAWAEQFGDADEAATWMDVGFWDPDAAARVRDLGLTAQMAAERAEALIEASEDAADEYTDGSPIYSICNGDTSADVLLVE